MSEVQQHVYVCQIKAFSVIAEIEGMKALNQERKSCGLSLAYGEDAFYACADRLNKIAIEAMRYY